MPAVSWSRLISSRARDVVYDLMVHMLWADGRVTPQELGAARGAADALGMDTSTFGGLFGRVGRSFESLGLEQLGPLERPLAYAAAVWMAMADDELAIAENNLLRRTRRSLEIPDGLAADIERMGIEHARGGKSEAGPSQAALEALLDKVSATMLAA